MHLVETAVMLAMVCLFLYLFHTCNHDGAFPDCLPCCCWFDTAVDASQFTPDPSAQEPGMITIIALTRLVYRKGIDLLAVILPDICQRHANVHIIICEWDGGSCFASYWNGVWSLGVMSFCLFRACISWEKRPPMRAAMCATVNTNRAQGLWSCGLRHL